MLAIPKRLYGIAIIFIVLLSENAQAENECRYDTWRDFDWRYPKNEAQASTIPRPLAVGKQIDFGNFSYYSNQLKKKISLEEYVKNNCVIGLMLLKDDRVVYENYFSGWKADTPLFSASVSKTLLGLITGMAVAEGKLSLPTKVTDIFPDYASSDYGQVTVEQLLRMISGARFELESIDPFHEPYQHIYEYLKAKRDFTESPGIAFRYTNTNSPLLGLLLRKVTGRTATDYLQEKLWQPIGAEKKAFWITNRRGEEGVGGQFLATARDYAKVGLLIMNKGRVGDAQVVPADWIEAMTTIRKDKPQPEAPPYYGLHVWLPIFRQGSSQMMGVHGQHIYIVPSSKIIVLQFAAQKERNGPLSQEFFPFRDAIVGALEKHASN